MNLTCRTLLLLTCLSQGMFGLPTNSRKNGDPKNDDDKATLSLVEDAQKKTETFADGVNTKTVFSEVIFDLYGNGHTIWSLTNLAAVASGGANPKLTLSTGTTGDGTVFLDHVSHVPTFATGTASIEAEGQEVIGAVEHYKNVTAHDVVMYLPEKFELGYIYGPSKDSNHEVGHYD